MRSATIAIRQFVSVFGDSVAIVDRSLQRVGRLEYTADFGRDGCRLKACLGLVQFKQCYASEA